MNVTTEIMAMVGVYWYSLLYHKFYKTKHVNAIDNLNNF